MSSLCDYRKVSSCIDSNYSLAGLLYQWWGAEQHKAGHSPTFVIVPEHHNAGGFPALVHVRGSINFCCDTGAA